MGLLDKIFQRKIERIVVNTSRSGCGYVHYEVENSISGDPNVASLLKHTLESQNERIFRNYSSEPAAVRTIDEVERIYLFGMQVSFSTRRDSTAYDKYGRQLK